MNKNIKAHVFLNNIFFIEKQLFPKKQKISPWKMDKAVF